MYFSGTAADLIVIWFDGGERLRAYEVATSVVAIGWTLTGGRRAPAAMQLSAPADQVVSIDIVLGRTNGVYRPGDHVTGHVIIDAKQDIPLCGTPSRLM